ncbi:acyl-CoA dehydrogenase family protein [Nocardia tengchongensis]|uniref:acyl-CoA dehydrogenase family protein n=1 Tax=Nocardia tengchongensis TaxID=2055889 RepID=UPI0036984A5E
MTDTGYLVAERALVEQYLSGLDKVLADAELSELEQRGGPALDLFRQAGGPALLIPVAHGGLGATPLEAVRIQRAIAGRSPSLAVGVMMHHLSVATFVEFLTANCEPDAFEWALLKMVAAEQMYVASASAEGKSGQSVLAPTMIARRDGDKFIVNGRKKPCSLSKSMTWLTASVLIEGDEQYDGCVGMAIITADSAGLEVRPFWTSEVLAGAESDEVVLQDVEVSEQLIVFTDQRPGTQMDDVQMRGWTWFEVLAAASYIGVAGALVERVVEAGRGSAVEVGLLHVRLESAMAAVENLARQMDDTSSTAEQRLAQSLIVRFAAQDTVMAVAAEAAALVGGLRFIQDQTVGYLLQAVRAMAFHPPSRDRALTAVSQYMAGGPLDTTVF